MWRLHLLAHVLHIDMVYLRRNPHMKASIKSPDELLADLGSRVKARRGAMTQMDLADKARVSRRALADLEAGNVSTWAQLTPGRLACSTAHAGIRN
jgi:hypothetical protein